MQEIFLSYSRDDQAIARRFATAFERAGLGVWWDQTLKPGEAFDEVTEKALNEARAVVVLWSKKSVASRWVRAEATQAHDNKTLIPVMIEACKRPIMFELTHTANLSAWNGDAGDPAWQAFLGNVRQFVGNDAPRVHAPAAAQPDANRPGRVGANTTVIAAVALLIAGLVSWAVWRAPAPVATPAAATSLPAESKQVTLAVLPFTNLSDDPRQEYFSDGLAEEILNQLAQVNGLLLTARTSSFSFKGKNEDARVIGKQLGVDNLLEGSVRKDGEQLRITAQLVNSRNGGQLWSQTYARRMSDIFAVQEDIAKDVARALSVKLDIGDTSRARGGTTNVAAYEKFLQGLALTGQGTTSRLEAIRVLREAVELDPAFPLAWFYLYSNLQLVGGASAEHAYLLGKDSELAEARVEALSPEAWWTKALVAYKLFGQRKWTEADAATQASMLAAAGTFLPCQPYTSMLLGRPKEAVDCAERLRRADPLTLDTSVNLQNALDSAGHLEEAQAEYERSRDLAGDHGRSDMAALYRLLALKGTNDAAVKAQYRRVLQGNADPLVRTVFDRVDDAKAARAVLHQAFADTANQSPAREFLIAMFADRFGDRDLALSALHRGLLELPSKYSSSPWWYWKTGLRTDPRFKDIVRGMGLVDYFRASGNWGDFCKPVGSDDFECH